MKVRLILFLLLLSAFISAQAVSFIGNVVDSIKGNPIPGATIFITGNFATSTNSRGN